MGGLPFAIPYEGEHVIMYQDVNTAPRHEQDTLRNMQMVRVILSVNGRSHGFLLWLQNFLSANEPTLKNKVNNIIFIPKWCIMIWL